MLHNYIKIALRSLFRTKAHSIINILGLGLGIACCVLISLYVYDEWTFDKFHSKADRIYRVYVKENWGENQQFFNTVTPFPMGPALKDNFPEVEEEVRINPFTSQVKVGENNYNEKIFISGKNFFNVFDFKIVSGDKNALQDQNGIVITERIALKYFGSSNPLDKIISFQIDKAPEDFFVKAVVANPPTNSSIQFDMLISDLNFKKMFDNQVLTSAWFNVSPETYILLKENANVNELESKFPSIFKTLLGEEDYNQSKYAPGLQPLTDIHLNTEYPVGNAAVSNPRYSIILAAVAILILIVACINFVTLSVGRSLKRSKEVGIRKVVGAQRKQLIIQFSGEALLITFLSLIAGLVISFFSMPFFNEMAGKNLSFTFNFFLLFLSLGFLIVIGLIAGSYPAFVLSAFKPIQVLKGRLQGDSKQRIRKVLVGVQLVLSVFLISSTLIMSKQLSFLQNKNLGFNKEQLAVVQLLSNGENLTQMISNAFDKYLVYKSELSKSPEIMSVCASSHDFGSGNWTSVGYTDENGTYRNFNLNVIDEDYVPTLKMELTQGRNFSMNNPADKKNTIIINESLAKEYGWTDAVGKKLPGKRFLDHEIIGVVKDFNFSSLYTKIQPLVLVQDPAIILSGVQNISINTSPIPKLIFRIQPGKVQEGIKSVKEAWNKLEQGEEFKFSFVDQKLDAQYKSDQNLGKIVSVATLLSILIGSLGLYALASLAMQNRTKEISIRKVMGATEKSLLLLLSKDYVLLLLISLLISAPITFYVMDQWLLTFEYRIGINWNVFALAGIIALVITITTISYQAIKTAWTKPADTLKYE